MLGHMLCRRLSRRFEVVGSTRNGGERLTHRVGGAGLIGPVDAQQVASVRSAITRESPDVVVNAIGIVKQVAAGKDVIQSLEVNAILPHHLARMSEELGFRLITISTDCIFSGRKGMYRETDEPDATDLYAVSKRFGEPEGKSVLVLRTSIIGPEVGTRHGLLEWFLSNVGTSVNGFERAIFSGLPTVVLSDLISDLIADHPELNGMYHVSAEPISKLRLLEMIRDIYSVGVQISPKAEPAIDRSLDSSKFRQATGWEPADWPGLLGRMADEHRDRSD